MRNALLTWILPLAILLNGCGGEDSIGERVAEDMRMESSILGIANSLYETGDCDVVDLPDGFLSAYKGLNLDSGVGRGDLSWKKVWNSAYQMEWIGAESSLQLTVVEEQNDNGTFLRYYSHRLTGLD